MANQPPCIDNFWEAYGNSSILEEIECEGPTGSLATHVLDTFGLNISSKTSNIGGNLYGLDIKHMDAMAVINLSLLEALAESGSFSNGTMYEPIVNSDGDVEFIKIGGDIASLSDIYYQVQSSTYVEECKGVLIRGGKVLSTWKDTSWELIWKYGGKYIYDTTELIENCSKKNFSTHALIVFNDPNLENSEYNDGINNLYELTDPFERILGYAHFIDAPGSTKDTKITLNKSVIVPIELPGSEYKNPDMGTLIPPPSINPEEIKEYGPGCWKNFGEAVKASDGVKIPLPSDLKYESVRGEFVDKFQKVEEVYIIGRALSLVKSASVRNDKTAAKEKPTDSNTVAVIAIEDNKTDTFKLSEGKDYTIAYEKDGYGFNSPYIVFAKNARVNEPKAYGKNTDYIISPGSITAEFEQGKTGKATIFPAAGNKGYWVEQILVLVSLDAPSISIYDPEYNDAFGKDGLPSKARVIADNLKYYVKPIVAYEPTPSIAFNGKLVNQKDGVKDHDPTTQQDLEATELELIMDQLDGGMGVELTLPFLNNPKEDDSKLVNLSKNLFEFMNSGTGIETTYVCGPNTKVELGQVGPSGGVVNNISYSYTDSGSYTISVNEGPRMVKPFSGGGPAGPTIKATESFNARGTVIQSMGNGIHFKVRIDGFTDRVAINMTSAIIREGDVVSCSVYNNPVEV